MSRSSHIVIAVIQEPSINADTIAVPDEICDQLNKYSTVELKVGASKVEVKYLPNDTNNILMISQKLADELSLYSGMRTNLLIKENKLCLGPVIGTFTDSTSVRIANEQKAGNKMKSLSFANWDAETILYFFSVDDFYCEEQKINGTYYNYDTNRWEQRLFPIPDVLYDRGGGILKSQLAPSEYIRRTLENNENVKKFNPRFYFDKWDVYNKLKRYKEIDEFLPMTVQYRTPRDLSELFEKSDVLYIKDRKGNRGLGVVRVLKHSDGSFELSYFKKALVRYQIDSFEALLKIVDELFKNKKAIIQQAIDVIKVNNGNVDMRATVQRDGEGRLWITACPVRVGKERVPITSTRSGSQVYRFEDFFNKFLCYTESQIYELKSRVDRFLHTTYQCIEDLYGIFGEIGIDFAIDNDGKIWFIECNAKPGKDTVYLSYDVETVRKAFLNPLEYSKFLCGF